MTTIYTAAAARRAVKAFALAGTVAVLGLGLAGCETSSSLLGSANSDTPPTQVANTAPAAQSSARLAVAPVIGAPENVAKQLQASLGGALQKQKVTVAQNATDKADYTLRGYVVSAREKTGVKVSYIWDVTDPAGQRLNRITGEEIVAGATQRDPWQAITPPLIETISTKAAGQVVTWLSSQKPASAGSPAAAATPVAAVPAAAPKTAATATPPAGPTTGSIGREGPSTAFVPNVTGAPGDGRISLTSALQRELSKSGVTLANAAGNSYRVEGVVDVGQAKDGKQPIKIDWHVKDATGKSVGTVSQKNEIAAGALDGAWGATADAAAAAAAQGILKLLPKAN